jgi:tetratricopeptide (TPR) repeat protein
MTAARAPRIVLLLGLALALVTLALYWPVTSYPFINFDDDDYITGNSVTQAGLTWPGFIWAFSGLHVSNWHPASWLSHMLDCQLFGVHAGGHHFTSVLFHIVNTLLLFGFLRSTTGAIWRSAAVAALFAWHPLHVESVAWISERKDVLSTCFWLLTLMAYTRYAKSVAGNGQPATNDHPRRRSRPAALFYLLALAGCAAALMSKAMAVTLPCTLLLLDVWPLCRIQAEKFNFKNCGRLLLEKIPFFFLSFAFCAVTFLAQRGAGAVSSVEWSSRLGNVPVAYVRYLAKSFWPADLAIVYPYVYRWPTLAIVGSALLLIAVSALAVRLFRQKPWLAVGWFWFLGTLVPVIGFVQVGAQSMADRYTYIPSIGLFVVVVWGMAEHFHSRPDGKLPLAIVSGSALLGLVLATSLQITYWRSSTSLFLHAIEVTQNNYVAENALGKEFEKAGELARARALYTDAVRIEPRYAVSQYNLGIILIAFGEQAQALEHLAAAARLDPNNADAQFNLGVFFLQHDRWEDAVQCFEAGLKLRPDFAPGHWRLGQALVHLGKISEATAQFHEALRLDPASIEAKKALAALPAAPAPAR